MILFSKMTINIYYFFAFIIIYLRQPHKCNSFTAGTILNDTIYIKKNNLNTHYKNLSISANVNLAFRNINTSEPSQNENEFNLPLRLLL